MAKKTNNENSAVSKELIARSRYPIGLLFQVSTLAGCSAYLLFSISGRVDMITAFYRALVVFIGFSVCFGILLATVVSILHKVKMKEAEEKIQRMHEELIAEKQLMEAQLRQEHEEREARLTKVFAFGDSADN